MSSSNFPDTRFRLEARQYTLQQNYDNNQSLIRGELWVIKQGSSTRYATDPTSRWDANLNHWNTGANFGYDFRNSSEMLLDRKDQWVTHDGEGHYWWFHDGYANLTNIGQAWTHDEGWLARIPKVPGTPGAPSISLITTTTARLTAGIPDNRGANIDAYNFQLSTTSNFSAIAQDWQHNGHITDAGGMTPGVTYFARARAHNSRGWGAWSGGTQFATQPALYVSNGTDWLPSAMQVSDGNAWVGAELLYSNGSQWLNPLPK